MFPARLFAAIRALRSVPRPGIRHHRQRCSDCRRSESG